MNLDLAGSPGALTDESEFSKQFSTASADERGAIFTRGEVVEFILDLVGYSEDRDLAQTKLLEPSAGHADFLLPIVGRLIRSYVAHGGDLSRVVHELALAIRAYEVHESSLETARSVVVAELLRLGVKKAAADALGRGWLVRADFLMAPLPHRFDFVVGNPPYVRQELIPARLLANYRARFKTLYDRADLYIPFYERCLGVLAPGGRLGFICTDRWTKNKYGGPLRAMVSEEFALTHFVDLVNTQAFLSNVMTYPAITVIERPKPKAKARPTRVAYRPAISAEVLGPLAKAMTGTKLNQKAGVVEMSGVVNGSEPWILHQADRLALVRRLEETLPTLEEAGCKVGIGVATGNDGVYIGDMKTLNVEQSRKLPLVRTQDLRGGSVDWQGKGVLNPFEENGQVVDLASYPKFAAYLQEHATQIKARHVAKKNPQRWFRTIDRIYPALAKTPKLLVPDIKGDAHIVYEEGKLYPHHNLYFITTTEWDLRALQAVLMSGMARLFVGTYSTKMLGGFLRFQAQYLRRIRVPYWKDVPEPLRKTLRDAAVAGDRDAANSATYQLYGLNEAERDIIATV
ncbi:MULTISPECIES: Eco57I restriction-modification methylase domain-containing protein [Xanthomonas]|uniref:Eco57I restriction-modification methylase domain-containing protein n=1 Tax=Xanthomonas TaxID=338 RepID=UPI0004A7F60B|nr:MULTISPECIES: Eco57I restriction-modification methylase domain-containing protein [Xanthomonas]MCE4513701.1 Eco57I restriction-modification methylase domain-containing protein [Xanthomonas hortorum pv. vitians]MCE4522331.1 Eco57I restriction-modification methylase domain-containing protein [Xanthomonas hortorum pv. vitians]QTK40638.1 Eco57I restriction-modification methylase domain-containing protein [Xanthomonas citri pv. glycines]